VQSFVAISIVLFGSGLLAAAGAIRRRMTA
jgi:hypothetical protein